MQPWQLTFVSVGIVVILLEMLRGWRAGLMRQLVRIIAVIAGYACAIYGGRAVLPLVRSVYKMPDLLLSIIGGVLLAFVVYAVITSLGVVLFKRTTQHGARVVRIIWGSSGALLGVFFGALFIWLVFAGVRLIGSVAAAQVHARDALTSATMQPVWNRPLKVEGKQRPPRPEPGALAATLAQMKESLETGTLGGAVKDIDPVPPATYRTLEKLGAVASNVESAQRFLSFPRAREIGADPKVVALRIDPEIADLIAHGRIVELLQNQRLIEAMNDPLLRERIKRFDLERALDCALPKR
ncbi:MAG: CvpA family protein [Chthoniobacterales bacterium]